METKLITRSQMFDAVSERMPAERPTGNDYAAWGARMKFDRANALLKALNAGLKPSTNQVVAYFGAGARFDENS